MPKKPAKKSGKKRVDKQERFIEEYLIDRNATQAAIRAGYSKKTASEIGYENLTKPQIKSAIAERTKAHSDKLELSAERILKEMMRIGFANLKDLASWKDNKVTLTDSDKLSDDASRAVSEVSQVTTYNQEGAPSSRVSIKTHSKTKALEMLARNLSLFNDKLAITDNTLADLLVRAYPKREG